MSLTKVPYSMIYGSPANVLDFGADPAGLQGSSAAVQAAINASAGDVYVPDGVYLIDSDLIVPDNVSIYFSGDAVFKASANNRTFFKSTSHAYFSQIHNAQLDGNGKTGVVGFDMTNFRLNAGIFNPFMTLMEYGFIGRQGCFGLKIANPTAYGVKYPIVFIENNSASDIDNPNFDNSVVAGGDGTGTGVTIQYGSGSNLGAKITGGYIQGYTLGVDDGGIGTLVNGTYFEACTTADITANTTAKNNKYVNCEHWGAVGNCAYSFTNTDSIVVQFPTMASGARTQMFNVDATNTNCKGFVVQSAHSLNTPLGTTTGIFLSGYTQSFTVADASGAGLTFIENSTPYWSTSNNTVTVSIDITYPTTSDTSLARINLPINGKTNVPISGAVGFTTYGSALSVFGATTSVAFYLVSTSGALTNANMSGKRIAFTLTYIAV